MNIKIHEYLGAAMAFSSGVGQWVIDQYMFFATVGVVLGLAITVIGMIGHIVKHFTGCDRKARSFVSRAYVTLIAILFYSVIARIYL